MVAALLVYTRHGYCRLLLLFRYFHFNWGDQNMHCWDVIDAYNAAALLTHTTFDEAGKAMDRVHYDTA